MSSILVYIFGFITPIIIYSVKKFGVDLVYEQKEIISSVSEKLVFYGNIYTNPVMKDGDGNPLLSADRSSAYYDFRSLGSKIRSQKSKPFYNFFSKLGLVIVPTNVDKVSSDLIGLANGMWADSDHFEYNVTRRDNLEKILEL